jgi:AP endonuclease-2
MPWIKHGDIQADVKGSDHCPVYVDLHDEITTESGIKLDLWEQMNPGRKQTDPIPDPPHFAARFYPEFKQNLLSTFFNKPKPLPVPTPAESPAEELSVEAAFSKLEGLASQPDPPGPAASTSERPSAPSPQASTTAPKAAQSQPVAGSSKLPVPERPSLSQSSSATALQKGKAKANGQASIASFFSPPAEKPRRKKSISQSSASKRKKDDVIDVDDDDGPSPQAKKRKSPAPEEEVDPVEMMAAQAARAEAWSSLFANSKKETPLCKVHGEPCKQFEVKKPGPNKGGCGAKTPSELIFCARTFLLALFETRWRRLSGEEG